MRRKNITRNQILVSKLWYISQIYTIPKYQKGNCKKNIEFPLEQEKIQPPREWAQLSIWRGRLGILLFYTDTIKLAKNKMDSKFIKSHQVSLERSHAVFWLKLIMNSDHGLAFSRKKQILTALLVKKKNNEDFFIQLLYAWLHLTNDNIPSPYL